MLELRVRAVFARDREENNLIPEATVPNRENPDAPKSLRGGGPTLIAPPDPADTDSGGAIPCPEDAAPLPASIPGPPAPPVSIVTVRPRTAHFERDRPPALPLAKRKIRVAFVQRNGPNVFNGVYIGPLDEEHDWVRSPNPVGRPIVVDGKFIAAFAAARVHSFGVAEDGVTHVVVEAAFAPFDDGATIEVEGKRVSLQQAWRHKLMRQDNGALWRDFVREVTHLLERVEEIEVHLVLRFVAGPPMDRESAFAPGIGYHHWPGPLRSPTRVEIDRRQSDARNDAARDVYLATQLTWWAWIASFFWFITNKSKYELYTLGKALAEKDAQAGDDEPSGRKSKSSDGLGVALTAVASGVAPMVKAMASTLFASDPRMIARLEERGRPMQGTRLERGTYMTYAGEQEERLSPRLKK